MYFVCTNYVSYIYRSDVCIAGIVAILDQMNMQMSKKDEGSNIRSSSNHPSTSNH